MFATDTITTASYIAKRKFDSKVSIRILMTEAKENSKVFITGSFNNWQEQVPMEYNPKQNRFEYKIVIDTTNTPEVLYKFIIDGEWIASANADSKFDSNGNLNNVIDVQKFKKPAEFPTPQVSMTSVDTAATAQEKPEKVEKVSAFKRFSNFFRMRPAA